MTETRSPESLPPPPPAHGHVSCFQNMFRPPERGDDYTILQAVFSIDLLLLTITTLCGTGGMLTIVDNLGQLGVSLGYQKKSVSTFVSLVGIWNYVGRVGAGFVSEIVITKYKFNRPLLLTLVNVLACLGHLLIAFNVPYGLYFTSVIIGFCFGAQFPILLATISDIFGLKYYSTLFNFGALATPFGSYLMNVTVTGYLYDKEGLRQLKALGLARKVGEELNCDGHKCFELAFIIVAAVTAFGALASIILVIRTRKFYRSDIYKKFREADKAAEAEVAAAKGNGVVAAVTLEERSG